MFEITKEAGANIYASAATGDPERTKKTLRKEGLPEFLASLYVAITAAVKRLEPIAAQEDARREQLSLANLELEDAEKLPLENRVEARAEVRRLRGKIGELRIKFDESDTASRQLLGLRQHFPALFGLSKRADVNQGRWPPANNPVPPEVAAELDFLGVPQFTAHSELRLNRSHQELAFASGE